MWTFSEPKKLLLAAALKKEEITGKMFTCLKVLLLHMAAQTLFAKAGGFSPGNRSMLYHATWKTSESPLYVLIWTKTKRDETDLSSQSQRSLRVTFSNASNWPLEIFLLFFSVFFNSSSKFKNRIWDVLVGLVCAENKVFAVNYSLSTS